MSTVMKDVKAEFKICDLCGEGLGETQWQRGFQHIKPLKQERPLKTSWYRALRFLYDGSQTYDVHHTCLYELLRAYQEGKIK